MDTDKLKKLVNETYLIVSSLNVSGDAVDVVAAARVKLRQINDLLTRPGKAPPEASAQAAPGAEVTVDG